MSRTSDDPTMGPHEIYWGSHGCCLATVHVPGRECECDCCRCGEHHPYPDWPDESVHCVAKPPHYDGPDMVTHYYGDDNSAADEQWFRDH